MSRRKFSYTIFRHFTNDTNMKRKAEIWKQAIEEVMCYSHHLEHIWLYSIIIFYIGDPLAALFTKCHLFVTSGIIWILYSQKKVNVKQKVLQFHWPARQRRHTDQWSFTPNVSGKSLQYSSLFTNYRQHIYRWMFSQQGFDCGLWMGSRIKDIWVTTWEHVSWIYCIYDFQELMQCIWHMLTMSSNI